MTELLDQLLRLVSLRDANTRTVLLGVTVLGASAGLVGAMAVLRRRALVGDAVAHAALPGLCIAYMIVGERSLPALLVGALVAGLVASGFIALVRGRTRVKEDAAIALTIGGFFGVGIVLSRIVQNTPGGNRAGLDSFIFGKAAAMSREDAWLVCIAGASAVAVVTLLHKELKLLCFDRGFASSLGWPVVAMDLALLAMVCVCTVVGLPAVGVVLIVALLVIPGAAARFWSDRLGTVLWLSAAFGAASGAIGTALSATLPAPPGSLTRGWPTGPLVTLSAGAIFVVSMLVAPRRGVVAGAIRRGRLARRIDRQNSLRALYELHEADGRFDAPFSADELARLRDLSFPAARASLRRLVREGLAARATADGTASLTARGIDEARRIARAHRLWELYLIEQADIAPDHVDRDADEIEHVLPAALVQELESRLLREGRLPSSAPRSPHEIPHARRPAP